MSWVKVVRGASPRMEVKTRFHSDEVAGTAIVFNKEVY
jgi:hypothetical protein